MASGNGELFAARMGRYSVVPWIQWRTEVGGHRTVKGFACQTKEVLILSTVTLHSAKKPVQERGGKKRRKRSRILDTKKTPHTTGIASGSRPLKMALQFWGGRVPLSMSRQYLSCLNLSSTFALSPSLNWMLEIRQTCRF